MISIHDPQVDCYLDISTVHVTQEAMEDLCNPTITDWPVYEYAEGCFVCVPDHRTFEEDIAQARVHESVKDILEFASSQHYAFVRFDADGVVYQELERYDW